MLNTGTTAVVWLLFKVPKVSVAVPTIVSVGQLLVFTTSTIGHCGIPTVLPTSPEGRSSLTSFGSATGLACSPPPVPGSPPCSGSSMVLSVKPAVTFA